MTDRAHAIRRAMRNLDAWPGHTPERDNAIEREISIAYDAGHIAGSGVKNFSKLETDLLEAVKLMSNYAISVVEHHINGDLGKLMRELRGEDEKKEAHARMTDAAQSYRGISLDED